MQLNDYVAELEEVMGNSGPRCLKSIGGWPMEFQDRLMAVIGEGLTPLGFRRRSKSWYRSGSDLFAVVSVQRSSWDRSTYVNVGISPKEEAVGGYIPDSKCKVRFRVDALKSVSLADVALLNADELASTGLSQWREQVAAGVIAPLVRTLESATNLKTLSRALESDISSKVMVHWDIRARVGSLGSDISGD